MKNAERDVPVDNFLLVAGSGFEPELKGHEPYVLPLHYPATMRLTSYFDRDNLELYKIYSVSTDLKEICNFVNNDLYWCFR